MSNLQSILDFFGRAKDVPKRRKLLTITVEVDYEPFGAQSNECEMFYTITVGDAPEYGVNAGFVEKSKRLESLEDVAARALSRLSPKKSGAYR